MRSNEGRLPLLLPDKLPLPAGQSPFHIKGSAYSGLRSRQAKMVPGGLEQVLKFIEDPTAREFMKQKFMPSAWYDYLPALLLARASVAATGRDAEEFLSESAVLHAEGDLSGVYKVLLFFSSPEAAMSRMPQIHKQYFDFGRSEVQIAGKGVADSIIFGIPAIAASFYQLYVGEFVHRLIVLSGGKNPHAQWDVVEPDGERAGFPLVRLRVRTTWTK